MKDAKGITIKVDDEIAAALMSGRSPMLAFGRVCAVEGNRIQWRKTSQPYGRILDNRPTWLHFSERVLVVS